MRSAVVPCGTVPALWHPLVPPLAYPMGALAGIEFVPTTVTAELDSTRTSANTSNAKLAASATRTLRAVVLPVRGSAGMWEDYPDGGDSRRRSSKTSKTGTS
jgi:hypothetical protein